MKTRVLAILVALGILAFVGAFVWAAMRPPPSVQTASDGVAPTASVSEMLSDGRLDVQVYVTGNRGVRLEIQFMPDADAVETVGMRPDVNLAMVKMHMDGFTPPLELVEAGVWRVNLKLPMAGLWIGNVGFGEEFAEIQFDAP
ncbi:hypothetical protein [Cypionkella psychrotolerans]|uniref:hypothetical protein n=1 Tax=Cypionkella psychrotolerans TaxID=1678131 RepID=UPI0006B5ABEA|nr:hypothetical protein [Cypionkella psychrotolerans]